LHWIFGIIGAAPASVVAKVEIIFFSPFHFSRVLHNSRYRGCPDDPKDTNSICLENAKRLRDQRVLKQQKHVPKQRSLLTIDKFKSFSVLIPSKPLTSLYIN
jgi:hypothetical protein